MATFAEGRSSIIPSIFDGKDFLNWKLKMEFYLKSVNVKYWDIIENGCDITDEKIISINALAMHILYSHINQDNFNFTSHCENAQEIWNTFDAIYCAKVNNNEKSSSINSVKETSLLGLIEGSSDEDDDDEALSWCY